MSPDPAAKPQIIVVALSINPFAGSEPGKGWWWSSALSKHFRLHLITQRHSLEACKNQPIVEEDGWTFHPTSGQVTTWKFPTGYIQYTKFLNEARAIAKRLIGQFQIEGLCHVTLGSFRFLPPYHRLGIPYTVGPLGGGECSPWALNWERPTPLPDKIKEAMRPALNNSFALLPARRSCLGSAALVLATSDETERVVRRMGARKTAVVFPDAYDRPIDVAEVSGRRAKQADSLRTRIRLLWQGRPLWWKGPDLALMVMRQALAAGLLLELTMVSTWDGEFGTAVRGLAEKWGVSSHIRFMGGTSREKFLELSQDHHGMLAPSVHDSGGIPLIEAQSLGLPCLTFGLGGHKLAACPEAGVSESPYNIQAFVKRSVECLRQWQADPQVWLEQSKKAVLFSRQFTISRLAEDVGRLIVPALKKS
jgi:glycosyltransferase involved in cell wall biosynthesis